MPITMTLPETPGAPSDAQRRLGGWLDAHRPGSANPYAPSGERCTKYVEDTIRQGTGFDLYQAVANDMSAHAPGFHLRGTEHDGYRFSSPLAASGDPYDSDNVANYFRNAGELHAYTENHGMQVGDVLFFHGGDEPGLDHTAMVSKVDRDGHATQIAESTGDVTKYNDWNHFQKDYIAEGKSLVSFGRPDWNAGR